MKILIIRHGDPDYVNDSLTEKGRREAELLSNIIAPMNVKDYYVSPLGRARETASYTLKKCGREAEVLQWLREFDKRIDERPVIWDMLPEEWTEVDGYYDMDGWTDVPCMKSANVRDAIKEVTEGLDALLEKHGYRRSGRMYTAEEPNSDTIVLFCHFGVECIILGHLLGISPMVLWHGTMALPTSVTTVVTEERREGKAIFRMLSYGDMYHLRSQGEEVSFSGRFCELYTNENERH